MRTQLKVEIGKFKDLRKQLATEAIPGFLLTITCPWCKGTNVQDTKFCCDDLRRAIQLIMSEPPKTNNA